MSDEITVSGLDRILNKMDAIVEKHEKRSNRAVHSAGLKCQKVAKLLCPVGTPESTGIKGYHGGRLRQSILVDNSNYQESTCGTNVYYGIFVEKGTVKMRARPFLSIGYEEGKVQLLNDLKGAP